MSLPGEESNFLRFYFLNLKVASKAVRVYFDSVHPPGGLAGELSSISTTLKRLRFITKQQLNTLYPSPASNVKSEHFDTTLIVCLLRNLPPLESAPVTGWDDLPHSSDKSTGADLARFKWYRNKLAHHEDGKLSHTDYNQYWGDLEGAIGRLGGPSMLKESQSAQHVVLDKSLKEMLNMIRNNEKDIQDLHVSQEKHTIMINDLQTTIDNQKTIKEQHENKIQELNDSIQKGESQTQTVTSELSAYKGSIQKCTEEIEHCKKEIDKAELLIKGIQEKSMDKQNLIGDYTHQLFRLEFKFGNKFKEIDEQLATCRNEIDDIKKKHHNEDVTSGESKQKLIEDDTHALIDDDIREGTFVTIKAVSDGLLMLKQNGVLLMTGHAGTGKSRIGRHILHLFCKEDNSYKCIKLNTLKEWENMVSRQNKVIVLLDDIFGETNCIYDRETDTPILDKLHAYVRKGNIKLIITIRDTVTRQCREVFENHRLFKFDFIDLSSDKYKLSNEEKQDILTIYMKTVKKSDYLEAEGFTDCNGVTILRCAEVRQIITETPVKGFPLVVYQFVHNNKYFQLGSKFFVMPTEAILEEINELRRKGEIDKKCMIQYAVMVYTAVNENRINPGDGSNTFEVVKIIDAIYGKSIKLKKCNISDSVKYLLGSYLVNIPNQRSYRFHHTILQESVILSFAQIDDENLKKIIPLLSWSFFLKMVKSNDYKEKEGEVVLRIPTNSFELLAARLVTIYEAKLWNNIVDAKLFIYCFINTEICLQDDCILLIYFLDALEKEDYKNKHTENMIKSNAWFSCFSHLKRTNMFIAILVNLKQSKYILQKFDQEIKTSKNHFSIDFMKAALVSSMYESCSTKDLRSVEAIFHLAEKNKIPVLLDQGTINLVDIGLTKIIFDEYQYDLSDARCIFLSLCIWKAYEAFNVPVLEFLLSKYNRTPFDVNSFFEMIYRNEHVNYWLEKRTQPNGIISDRSLISFKQLKWMIDRFADIELVHTECLLRTACQLQMLDTVEYLASLCINFDVIFCLKISLGVNDEQQFCDKDLFEFLLSKTDSSSTDLIPVVILVLQRLHVPDYIFDAFIQLCLNNEDILTLACKNAHLYFATLLMEKGQNVDIQSALIATCMKTEGKCNKCSVYSLMRYVDMEFEKLELVKNIIGKFGYGKFDLKTVCQHAYNAGYFKIIEWFVQNIDITMLDVYFIIKSALIGKQSDLLEYIMTKTDIASLDKMEVFQCVTEHYTVECSTTILEIVSIIWEGTENKEELKFEEMVDTAYERKDFELLMRIHEKYCSYVSIDARKLLMSASENCRTDVAKWVFRNFSLASSDIDEGKLLMLACANDLAIDLKRCDMVKWILNSFKINPLNLKSGVLKLLNHDKYFMQELTDEIFNLVVYILENYPICPSKEDIKIMICKSQERRDELVNWFLQHDISCLLDKQNILNTACMRSEIKTIKLLTNYFSSLDMHQAMIHACTSNTLSSKTYYDNQIACLDLFWKQFDHDSNDINIIVSTVCKAKSISNNCMTWVLLNLPHDNVSTNKLLIACCKQGKINHVKYIFNIHKENNGQLDIEEALRQACSSCSEYQSFETIFTRLLLRKYNKTIICRIKRNKGMLVDYLFKRLRDKQSNIPIVFNDLIAENRYDLILYFLEEGCCRNMDMKSLMKQACRHGHVKLVQWILENIEQAELDIKSALFELCKCTEKCKLTELDTISGSFDKCSVVSVKKHCLALIWHYVQDIEMFEMDTVLKAITEVPPDMSGMYDELRNWIQYIQNINQIRIRKSESALLNSEEDKKQRRQQIYDDQNRKMLKDTLHINESSSSDDCPVELKRLRLEKE